MIGIVQEVKPEKSTSNFLIKFRTAANFYNLEYVYAIDNKQTKTSITILEKVKKKTSNSR